MEQLYVDVKDLVVLDVGSSTGGFVDCLLQHGAKKVYAVDTSYGELAWTLRNDPRVVVMERSNILHLKPFLEKVDVVTIDAGWTRMDKVLPKVLEFLKSGGKIIALLKPQYEAEDHQLHKGIVKKEFLGEVVKKGRTKIEELGFKIEKLITSPIKGGAGNTEFFLLLTPIDK